MARERLWVLQEVIEQLVCDATLKRLILSDDGRKELLVEHTPVCPPLRAVSQHDQAPLREGRPDGLGELVKKH